jgi:hypothetical protein
MRGTAGVRDDSLVILQSERSQFRARGAVIRVKNASNPQTFRDLYEHRRVVDIDYLRGRYLGDVQRKPKDVRVGLADVDVAGGNKKSTNLSRLNFRIRYAFSSRPSLLTTPIFNPCRALS